MIVRTIILGSLLGMGPLAAVGGNQFVLPKQKTKKLSKNELKESVGQGLRDAFMTSTNVAKSAGMCQMSIPVTSESKNIGAAQKTFGALHVELAQLQQKFSRLVESLIEDQKPFKHASRDRLQGALGVIQDVQSGLKNHEAKLSMFTREKTIEYSAVYKVAEAAMRDIKHYKVQIEACEGLKTT